MRISPLLTLVCVLASLTSCKSKRTIADDEVSASPAEVTAPAKPERPAVVTPKTPDELAARVLAALGAKDVERLAEYAPSLAFLERHCPEMAPHLRQAYTDRIASSIAAAKNAHLACQELDWDGATVHSVELKPGKAVDFYGCPSVSESSASFVITVGTANRHVEMASVLSTKDAYYVAAPLKCQLETPCRAIVANVEKVLAGAPDAPFVAPLSEDNRGTITVFCDGLWEGPENRAHLVCLRDAKTYDALAGCGEPVDKTFVTWPRKPGR